MVYEGQQQVLDTLRFLCTLSPLMRKTKLAHHSLEQNFVCGGRCAPPFYQFSAEGLNTGSPEHL